MQQQNTKRSLALPVTLVILVFSLIGNVFFYSQNLQHQQENRYKTGQEIFEAAAQSRQFLEELLPQLDALLQSKGHEERVDLKYMAGKTMPKGEALVLLTAEAARIAESSDSLNEEKVQHFIQAVDSRLQAVGNGSGTLNEQDQGALLALKQTLTDMNAVLGAFNLNMENNRSAMIRLSSGLDWIEIVEKLQPLMENGA
ncbi:hypothetical protein D3C78_878770 [compost metagenome]